MAVGTTNVKNEYAGDGVETDFLFDFAILADSQISVKLVDDVTFIETPFTVGVDYTITGQPEPGAPGTTVVTTVPVPTGSTIVIFRETPLTQDTEYIETGAFPAETHERALDKIVMLIQEVNDKIASGTFPGGVVISDLVMRSMLLLEQQVDSTTTGVDQAITLERSYIKMTDPALVNINNIEVPVNGKFLLLHNAIGGPLTLTNDAGGSAASRIITGTGADLVLEDATAAFLVYDIDAQRWQVVGGTGSGGVEDGDYTFDGFSARFNAAFTSTGLGDTLAKIILITYTPPLISLAASGSGTVREKGNAVTASTLTATITKRSDPIAEVRFYLNPATLLDTQVAGGAIPAGGVSTYNWTGSFSDNTTFRAEVDDNGDTGGPTTVTATSSFTFVYPYYFGAGAAGLSAAAVAALTKDIRVSTATLLKSFTATAGQVFYFAYPASYGALTSILDVNNFETIGDWTLRTENITGLDATAQSYRIYEFNNPVVAGTYDYTFKR